MRAGWFGRLGGGLQGGQQPGGITGRQEQRIAGQLLQPASLAGMGGQVAEQVGRSLGPVAPLLVGQGRHQGHQGIQDGPLGGWPIPRGPQVLLGQHFGGPLVEQAIHRSPLLQGFHDVGRRLLPHRLDLPITDRAAVEGRRHGRPDPLPRQPLTFREGQGQQHGPGDRASHRILCLMIFRLLIQLAQELLQGLLKATGQMLLPARAHHLHRLGALQQGGHGGAGH